MRNHLPRTSFGSVLIIALMIAWYGMIAGLAVILGIGLAVMPLAELRHMAGLGLFFLFLAAQFLPLLTLTGGWSLQLSKLRAYPIRTNALFAIETLLRVSTSGEVAVILTGACVGLARNPRVPVASALCLLLYIPFNLFVSLAARETLLRAFQKNRFRELFAVLVISAGVLPQVFLRTSLGGKSNGFWVAIAHARGTPWRELAAVIVGPFSPVALIAVILWIGVAYYLARRQFAKGLREEDLLRPETAGARPLPARRDGFRPGLRSNRFYSPFIFGDPAGAIVEKEVRSLLRMPRFRVVFGMACVFSIVVFVPLAAGNGAMPFLQNNFLPIVNLYGLLILGDSLLWNIFGFDRGAASIYFTTPVALRSVVKAKNIVAVLFIALQTISVFTIALLFRRPSAQVNVLTAVLATAVVAVFFMAIGNLSSVIVPRAVDANQTLRKQAGAQIQLWLLGSAICMFALVGFAFLARWAFNNDWALTAVFVVEFLMGLIFYRVATDSAIERGMRDRERILDALSKGPSPVAA